LGCLYCFAKFDQYVSPTSYSPSASDDGSILYPSCDSEFFGDGPARDALKQAVYDTDRHILVSISIKSRLSPTQAREFAAINAKRDEERRGLVKCSVSVTTKYHVDEFEPKAASYEQRLHGLKQLAEAGVPCSVNLKPVLPCIDLDEYREIVDDCAPYS